MLPGDKPLVWLQGEIKTPPFTSPARIEAGVLLRRLQRGESPGLPHSRPMPVIGKRCHELRIPDKTKNWRIFSTDYLPTQEPRWPERIDESAGSTCC